MGADGGLVTAACRLTARAWLRRLPEHRGKEARHNLLGRVGEPLAFAVRATQDCPSRNFQCHIVTIELVTDFGFSTFFFFLLWQNQVKDPGAKVKD